MSNTTAVNELARRKQLLKAESALNRQALRLDYGHVSSAVGSTGRAVEPSSLIWKVGAVAVPLLALMLVRRGGAVVRVAKYALAGWQVLRAVRRFAGAGRGKVS